MIYLFFFIKWRVFCYNFSVGVSVVNSRMIFDQQHFFIRASLLKKPQALLMSYQSPSCLHHITKFTTWSHVLHPACSHQQILMFATISVLTVPSTWGRHFHFCAFEATLLGAWKNFLCASVCQSLTLTSAKDWHLPAIGYFDYSSIDDLLGVHLYLWISFLVLSPNFPVEIVR